MLTFRILSQQVFNVQSQFFANDLAKRLNLHHNFQNVIGNHCYVALHHKMRHELLMTNLMFSGTYRFCQLFGAFKAIKSKIYHEKFFKRRMNNMCHFPPFQITSFHLFLFLILQMQ